LRAAAPRDNSAAVQDMVKKVARAADRTAVLAVGVVAGFAIGLSFNAGGRARIDGVFAGAPVPVEAGAAAPGKPAAQRIGPAIVPPLTGPIDRRVLARVHQDGRLRIGVFGDSFGVGVWAGLYYQLFAKDGFDVLRFGKEATGFTRYRQLDLESRAREQLAKRPVDVAIMSFGANDVQPIFAEGHLQPLFGPGWKRIIGDRLERFVATARSTGATPIWVGLPAMRDPAMDAAVRQMNAFYAERLRPLGVPFIDTRPASLDKDGQYDAHLPDPKTGAPVLARQTDGVHMTGPGYILLTKPLADRLKQYAARVRAAAHAPDPTAAAGA
jgi:uncharacterized protein